MLNSCKWGEATTYRIAVEVSGWGSGEGGEEGGGDAGDPGEGAGG